MIEHGENPRLPAAQLTEIAQNLLKIPKRHKLIHPCQERTRYANILDWIISAMSSLKEEGGLSKDLADRQQQIIVSSLKQLIELTRRECVQKSIILEMVLQYFIGTINAYWTLFSNVSKEIGYQYQHNAIRIERDYVQQLKRLQGENQQFKKDKDHRWRNMFMLIKDNRVHRKQNKKLLKSMECELDKNRELAEQVIQLQLENEKMKLRLSAFEGLESKWQNFVEIGVNLVELEGKIRTYPQRSKKLLKNELVKIEINQNKNLQEKLPFIIRAIEETGEIVDQMYEEDIFLSNFSYNISTQTELTTEERGVNTNNSKGTIQTQTSVVEHIQRSYVDTVFVKVLPVKKQKREGVRQSKNVMFSSTQGFAKFGYATKKEDNRSRHVSRKDIKSFTVCESLRITIFQGRIAYISTYNSQIFNGLQKITEIEKKVDAELKHSKRKRYCLNQVETQTDVYLLQDQGLLGYSIPVGARSVFKSANTFKSLAELDQEIKKRRLEDKCLQISQETQYCYCPGKSSNNSGFKLSVNGDESVRSSLAKKISKERINEMHRESERQKKADFRFAIKKLAKIQERGQRKGSAERQFGEGERESEDKSRSNISSVQKIMENDLLQEASDQIICSLKENNSPYAKTTKPTSEQTSEIFTPQNTNGQPFANSTGLVNQLKNSKPYMKRNQSSIVSQNQFKMLQSTRLSKLNLQKEGSKHKRTTTEFNENDLLSVLNEPLGRDSTFKNQPSLPKMKPLHRISQDLGQYDKVAEQSSDKLKKTTKDKSLGLPFSLDKEGEFVIRDMDFSKGIEKILKNMDIRHSQLINNSYIFKNYLASYFKCLYGKQLYASFMSFLINASSGAEEITVCLNRLSNPKLPQPFLADIFKTFVLIVHKCYQAGESPLASRGRLDILKYMVSQYLLEEESKKFEARMIRQQSYNVLGWFNCLEQEVRKGAIESELYYFLSDILIESQDGFSLSLIEQLAFFMNVEFDTFRQVTLARFQLGQKMLIHRFCLFCFRNRWTKMLAIQSTVQQEYVKKMGSYNESRSIKNVLANYSVLSEFKTIDKYFKYWLNLHNRYDCGLNKCFMMILQLNIWETRLKAASPLSMELRYINLAFEGLQKKAFYQQIRAKKQARERSLRATIIS